MNAQALESWAPRVLSILRIVAAVLFFEHGTQKLFGFPSRPDGGAGPEIFSLIGAAGVLELVGGALLIVGLFTRPVALVLSGQMAFAYWMAHAPKSAFPLLNGGDFCDPVLLHFLVHLLRWTRTLEPGRKALGLHVLAQRSISARQPVPSEIPTGLRFSSPSGHQTRAQPIEFLTGNRSG